MRQFCIVLVISLLCSCVIAASSSKNPPKNGASSSKATPADQKQLEAQCSKYSSVKKDFFELLGTMHDTNFQCFKSVLDNLDFDDWMTIRGETNKAVDLIRYYVQNALYEYKLQIGSKSIVPKGVQKALPKFAVSIIEQIRRKVKKPSGNWFDRTGQTVYLHDFDSSKTFLEDYGSVIDKLTFDSSKMSNGKQIEEISKVISTKCASLDRFDMGIIDTKKLSLFTKPIYRQLDELRFIIASESVAKKLVIEPFPEVRVLSFGADANVKSTFISQLNYPKLTQLTVEQWNEHLEDDLVKFLQRHPHITFLDLPPMHTNAVLDAALKLPLKSLSMCELDTRIHRIPASVTSFALNGQLDFHSDLATLSFTNLETFSILYNPDLGNWNTWIEFYNRHQSIRSFTFIERSPDKKTIGRAPNSYDLNEAFLGMIENLPNLQECTVDMKNGHIYMQQDSVFESIVGFCQRLTKLTLTGKYLRNDVNIAVFERAFGVNWSIVLNPTTNPDQPVTINIRKLQTA